MQESAGGGPKKAESRVGCDPDMLKHIPEDITSIHCDIEAKELAKELMKIIAPDFFPDIDAVANAFKTMNPADFATLVTNTTTKLTTYLASSAGDAVSGALGLGGASYGDVEPICIDALLELKICSLEDQLPVEVTADKSSDEFILEIQSKFAPMLLMPNKDWALLKFVLFIIGFLTDQKVIEGDEKEIRLKFIWIYLKLKEYTGYFDDSGVPKEGLFMKISNKKELAGEDHYHWYNMKVIDEALTKYNVSVDDFEIIDKFMSLEIIKEKLEEIIGPISDQPILNKQILEDGLGYLTGYVEQIAEQYNLPLEIPPNLLENLITDLPDLPTFDDIFKDLDLSPSTMADGFGAGDVGKWFAGIFGIDQLIGFGLLSHFCVTKGKMTTITAPADKKELEDIMDMIRAPPPGPFPGTAHPLWLVTPIQDLFEFIIKELIFVWIWQAIKMGVAEIVNATPIAESEYVAAKGLVSTWKNIRNKVREIRDKAVVREAADTDLATWTSTTTNVDAIPDDWPGDEDKVEWIKTRTEAQWTEKQVDTAKTLENWNTTKIKIDEIIPMAQEKATAVNDIDTWTGTTDNVDAIPNDWPGSEDKVEWIKARTKSDWEGRLVDASKTKDNWEDTVAKIDELKQLAADREASEPNAQQAINDWLNVQANVDAIPNGWASGDKNSWIDAQTSTDWDTKKGEANTQIKVLELIPIAEKNDIADGKYSTWLQNNDNLAAIPDSWLGSTAKNDWIKSRTEAEWNTKKTEVTAQIKVLELKPLANSRDTALADIETWLTDDNVNPMPDDWVGSTPKIDWARVQTVATWNEKEKAAQTTINDNMAKIFPMDFEMMAENWTKFGEFWIPPDGKGWQDAFFKAGEEEQTVFNSIITFVEQAVDAARYVAYIVDPEGTQVQNWGIKVGKAVGAVLEVIIIFEIKLILHEYLFKGTIEPPNTANLWCGTAGIVVGAILCSWMFGLPPQAQGVFRIIIGLILFVIVCFALYNKTRELMKFSAESLEINLVFGIIEWIWDFFTKLASVVSMFLSGWKNLKLDPGNQVELTVEDGSINMGENKGKFLPCRVVTLRAVVPAGKKFESWKNATGGAPLGITPGKDTKPTVNYTVQPSDNPVTIKATFTDLPKMALTIGGTPTPSGDIMNDASPPASLGATIDCYEGQVVKIKAKDKSADGQGLKAWKITSTPAKGKFGKTTAAETTFTMPKPIAAVNIEAEFENLDYTLKLTGGKITTDPNKEKTTAKYNKTAVVGIASKPPAGKQFSAWTTDPDPIAGFTKNTDPQNLTMPAGNVTLTASFTDKEHTVTVNGGKVDGQANKALKYNATAPIKADDPAAGQKFKEWTGDTDKGLKSTTKANTSIKIPDLAPGTAIGLTATFENILYNFSVKGGKIKGGTHDTKTSAKLAKDEVVTVAATVPAKKELATWKITPAGANLANANDVETSVTMPADNVKVEATFNDIMYNLRVTGGKIKGGPSNGQTSGSFKEGQQVSVIATVPANKVLDTWEITTTPVPTGARLSSPKKATARVKIGAGNITVKAKLKNK